VRTPLTGILALAELLSACDLPERERRWAAAVKSGAEHLAELTTLVVDGTRARGGKFVLKRDPFRLSGLLDSVVATLAARAEAKGLSVRTSIPPGLPDLVAGDAVRLRAALENLIDNAVKFTEHGHVGLTVRADPIKRKQLRLSFTIDDTGVGLKPQEITRLFRPFSQANDQVARRFGGAGLGLAFVRPLAKAMGGDVTVTSRPGKGSSFRLDVIVDQATAKTSNEASDNAGLGGARAVVAPGLRVVCVEDNPYARVVLNTILSELGHQVDFVGTGAAAVETVARDGYDLVLLDVTLPDMSGIEVVRRIRRLKGAAGRVPIVGVSGRARPADQALAREAGMSDYLVKPVSPSELARLLGSLPLRR